MIHKLHQLGKPRAALALAAAGALAHTSAAYAETVYRTDTAQLDVLLELAAGIYHGQRNYAQSGTLGKGSSSWQEGYAKLGTSGHLGLSQSSQIFGALSAVTMSIFGDGDPAGWTNGSERETVVTEAYAGWRSGNLFPALGQNGSRFSANYDPLFYGNVRGLGTWYPGEVAANYAGPFNSNVGVHHIGVRANAGDNLTVGVLANRFRTIDRRRILQDAWEVDLYAEWMVGQLLVIPVLAYYKPKYDTASSGAQVGTSSGNFYSQVLFS